MTWTDLLPDPPRHRCANWPDCPSMTARRAPDGLCGACNEQRPDTTEHPAPAPADSSRPVQTVQTGARL